MMRLICLLLFLTLFACGYQVPGNGSAIPDGIKALYLPLFLNQSAEPRLENSVTDAVAEAFSQIHSLRLVSDKGEADTFAEGVILSYGTSALSYDSQDNIREYLAWMAIELKLRRASDGKLLWQNRVEWHEPYLTNADKSIQNDLENAATREIERRIADELLFRLQSDF
ncbi:MAG TPA: LPS assembly lipoprotein LptE [Geopsychrobacteraceae bacterium]|nr:LPS assembly lipoprotein LptE [Geopsychrobacteraceae bacterium]